MVSGLVTSPCDQLRIFSGEATLILMESKSATAFPRSNGLERYKVSSCSRYAAYLLRCCNGGICISVQYPDPEPKVRDPCPSDYARVGLPRPALNADLGM